MSNFVRFVILAALLTTSSIARAETLRFFQASDFQLPRLLSNDERSQLGDPMFLFVLKDHAEITNVETVMQLIQPDQSKHQIFSVDESITIDQGNARRGVVAFTGIREGEELRGNVMLSVITPRTGFPRETTFIEAWGWDNHRERYNYYKLDLAGSPPGEGPTWKFRGSSENADLLSPAQRKGTCLKCHINGAPVMKELFRPWNNWHSQDFDARYLSGNFAANPWPLSQDPIYRISLQQAERLELMIVEAVRRFNKGRVNAVLKRNDNDRNIFEVNGFRTVLEGQRLLRPLFRMTEFNLISAVPPQGVSGLGPFGNPKGTVTDIVIPASFFLNFSLIAGAGSAGYLGLEIDDARRFTSLGRIEKDEYSQLVHSHQLRMNGITGRDAHFAWFVPGASHIDNDLVD
jgi:hypothetical protein